MAVFEYKGLNHRGKNTVGVIDADNPKQARSKLRQKGIFPTELTSAKDAKIKSDREAFSFSQRITLSDTALETRQLSTLLGAGLSIMESLAALIEQTENKSSKKVWVAVREEIKEGSSLADALTLHPKVFSTLYSQMVRAGEASGALDEILLRTADYLENQVKLRGKIFAAMTYPILMMTVSTLILLFLVTFVVPKVTSIFADLNQALPGPTIFLLAISDFLQNYWLLLSAGIAGSIFWIRRSIAKPEGRAKYDRFILHIPLVGRLAKMVAISRFTKTLATLLSAGVQLLKAMEIVQAVVGNLVLEEAIQEARTNIREGASIAEPLKKSGLFPPLVTHMISIGEKSGELENMLQKVSEAYDNEVDTVVTAVTSLLGPIMILGMGGAILFIVLAILLPIFEVSQMVG